MRYTDAFGRREGDGVVAAAVRVVSPGAGDAEEGAFGQAFEVAGIERSVGGHDDHAGAVPGGVRSGRRGDAGFLLVEGHAPDGQDAAEVRLDEDAHRVAAPARGQPARGGPDAALVVEAGRARARADHALGDGSARGGPDGLENVGLGDVAAPDVAEPAVVRLSDDRVDRRDLLISGEAERPVDDGVGGRGDAQSVGQDDGRFDRAQLLDLGHPGQLAVAVSDRDPGRDLVLEDVAAVGDDGRDARPDVLPFDERDSGRP